jgi:hypothetical protein
MKFKKISAVLGTILLTGLTLGTAAAASYPAPFVDDGEANVAIVYGTGAGVSSLDMVQAGNIQTSLGGYVDGGSTTTVEGGETFVLEKTSNKFNYGEALNSIYRSLGEDQLDSLADGEYDDGDIDEAYEQEISLSSKTLSLFSSRYYEDEEPTVGFAWSNNEEILNYTMEFDDPITMSDMNDTEIPLMGNSYYVLTSQTGKIELLDSADKTTIAEGESLTVGDRDVSIYFLSSDGVKLEIDGEYTKQLTSGQYDELDDGSYVVVTEVLFSTKEGTTGSVEFSIGNGKMVLEDGEEVELNEEEIDNLYVHLSESSTGMLDSITFQWKAEDDQFLTEESPLVMPGFESIKLLYNGLSYGSDSEVISLDNGEILKLSMDNYDLPVMWFNGTLTTLGEEYYELVLASTDVANYTEYNTTDLVDGLDLNEDNRFLVTNIDVDLTDIETAYYQVKSIDYTAYNDFEVVLEDLIGDKDLTFDSINDVQEAGDIEITLLDVDASNVYLNFTVPDTLAFNKAVSKRGMIVTLPTSVDITDTDGTASITFTEADKDEDLGDGTVLTATIKLTSNDELHVSAHNGDDEEVSDDVYEGYISSNLASKIYFDKSGDEYDFEIEYFGEEVSAEVLVGMGGTVTTSGSDALGDVLVRDSEVSSVSSKNLIIVGGSCINSAAANVLGGNYCGAAFTQATGVGAGQFLIKGVQDAYTTGKLALVVAGYDAADTVNAATYLTKKDVDTSETYIGTSSTSAELVVA